MYYMGPFILVISNGVKANSSDVFAIIDPDSGGGETFSSQLQAIGDPATVEWACSTLLPDDVYTALTTMTVQEFKDFVNLKAEEYGRDPVGSVTAFKNNVRISEAGENFELFIASLGLELATP